MRHAEDGRAQPDPTTAPPPPDHRRHRRRHRRRRRLAAARRCRLGPRSASASALRLGLRLPAEPLALLVLRDRRGGGVLECGELGLELALARLLLVERRLRGIRRVLRRDHLCFGFLLQPVALVAGHDRLVAEALRGVARGDRLGVDGVVALDELVHRAQAREQVVGRRGRAGEEELERRVVAAVAVELRGDAAGLVRGIQSPSRPARRPAAAAGRRGRRRRSTPAARRRTRRPPVRRACAWPRHLVGERLDERLDLGDLGRLGGLVRLGALRRRPTRGSPPRTRREISGPPSAPSVARPEDPEAERAAAAHGGPEERGARERTARSRTRRGPARAPRDPPAASVNVFHTSNMSHRCNGCRSSILLPIAAEPHPLVSSMPGTRRGGRALDWRIRTRIAYA